MSVSISQAVSTPSSSPIKEKKIPSAPCKIKNSDDNDECVVIGDSTICRQLLFGDDDNNGDDGDDNNGDDGDDDYDGDDGDDDYDYYEDYEDYEDKYEQLDIFYLRADYIRYTRHVKDISFESYCSENNIFYRNGIYIRYLTIFQ